MKDLEKNSDDDFADPFPKSKKQQTALVGRPKTTGSKKNICASYSKNIDKQPEAEISDSENHKSDDYSPTDDIVEQHPYHVQGSIT